MVGVVGILAGGILFAEQYTHLATTVLTSLDLGPSETPPGPQYQDHSVRL